MFPWCGLETKEPGSRAFQSTGNPRPCSPLLLWASLGGGGRTPTEGLRGILGELCRVKVHKERGRGVIQEVFPKAVNSWRGSAGAESWAPLGAEAPPLPPPTCGNRRPGGRHGRRPPQPALRPLPRLQPAPGLCRGTDHGEGPSRARPPCVQVGKTSGRAPCYTLQPRSPAVREGRRMS